ncbi:MAG: Sec-independent protein translocase protein TatB [Oligoflexales bacterium]
MFGIGFVELCVIIVVALVFVGPKKLPEMMKQAGKFFVQVRRMTTDVKSTMDDVIQEAEQEIRREEREHITKLVSPGKKEKKEDTPHEGPDGSVSVDPKDKQDNSHESHAQPDQSHAESADSKPSSSQAKQEKQQG